MSKILGQKLDNSEELEELELFSESNSMGSALELNKARYVIHNVKTDLEKELLEAVNTGQLDLHYQPIISLVSGRIVGLEALIRWYHPEKGLIPTTELILAAEETGLILNIDEWVLKTACVQNKIWQDSDNPDLRICVNVSPLQFQRNNFPEMIKKVLDETGMSPDTLELEITENAAIKNLEQTKNILENIRKFGVKVSIDDFGTGYCSMEYLKSLPVDSLKIDRTFIADIKENRNDLEIIRATISMAHGMGLNVIAEGVEDYEQLQFLLSNKCDEMQGFLFSKAVDVSNFDVSNFNELINRGEIYSLSILLKALDNLRNQYIGQILIRAGHITDKHLEQALTEQQKYKGKVGQILLRQGIIDEDTLLNALASQTGTLGINIFKHKVDSNVINLVTKDVVLRYKILPIEFINDNGVKKLLIAMCDPSNVETLRALEFVTGYKIKPIFTLEEHLYLLIHYYY